MGIPMAIGVLLASPSDVSGSLYRRIIGISLSVFAAVLATLIFGYLEQYQLLYTGFLGLFFFGFSMISVYGFRASLVAFSGLFAIVLSMAKIASESGILLHALLIGLGGLWYLILTFLLYLFNRGKEAENLLAETSELTAEYLELRNALFSAAERSSDLTEKLVGLQTAINEKHETMRDMLISRRRRGGRSRGVRKELLLLSQLVDILEIGMAHPVNIKTMQRLFTTHTDLVRIITQWNLAMALELRKIAGFWRRHKLLTGDRTEEIRQKGWEILNRLEEEAGTSQEEALLLYRNLLLIKEKQHHKILLIKRLLGKQGPRVHINMRNKDIPKFISSRKYDFETLRVNLDSKSPIFRHSLRLTLSMLAGFFIGKLFNFQNPYWILLTTLVIMRPGYALTKERFKQRLYGTLIGAAVAVSLVLLVQSTLLYAVLAVITLVLAFSMIQNNYKAAAAFITLNVIFTYSLMRPDALDVIQFRVLDTLVGAGLAFFGAKFLWPTWEYSGIDKFVQESISANCEYVSEIGKIFDSRQEVPVGYKLARKRAFLAMGDLSAAFQRMAQESQTRREQLKRTFQLVSLNHEFLSATASLGALVMQDKNSREVKIHFSIFLKAICQNLNKSVAALGGPPEKQNDISVVAARDYFRKQFKELIDKRNLEREQGKRGAGKDIQQRYQEVHIIAEQLNWLLEISENMKNLLEEKKAISADSQNKIRT